MSIASSLQRIKTQIPSDVELVAVSKTKPVEMILEAIDAGHFIFGENQAQELKSKAELLPKEIRWHFIGHLQRNKVKYIAEHVSLIHSVDSLKLLLEIEKQAAKHDRIIDYLIQINISGEESKSGMTYDECNELFLNEQYLSLEHCQLKGLMGIASLTSDQKLIRMEFKELKMFFDECQSGPQAMNKQFEILSMGMSGDYDMAIEEGSNAIRVGSAIFGKRNYSNMS